MPQLYNDSLKGPWTILVILNNFSLLQFHTDEAKNEEFAECLVTVFGISIRATANMVPMKTKWAVTMNKQNWIIQIFLDQILTFKQPFVKV